MLGGGRALYVGRFHALPKHRFAATAVLVGLDDAFDIIGADGRVEQREAAVVGGWHWHGLDFHGGRGAVLFLEPGAGLERDLKAADVRDAVEAALSSATPEPWAELFQTALHLGPYERSVDQRIARLASQLATSDEERMNAAALARRVGASTSLIEHRFKEQVGFPIGGYRAWHRMLGATALALGGQSLTHVAHAAGFYDSAHFSRLFHRMFGLPPSAVFTHGLTGAVVRARQRGGSPLR